MGAYIVHSLLNDDNDGFIEKLNFHIIIVANPDGYEYSRNTGDFFEKWNKITPQTHIRKFEEQIA